VSAGRAAPVAAAGPGDAEVGVTKREARVGTLEAREAEAVVREHRAEPERMGAAAAAGGALVAGLVEWAFLVAARPAPLREAVAEARGF